MDYEEKAKVDKSPEVDRMGVYRMLEKGGWWDGKYAVVVSADHRKHDRFASIIMLTSAENENGGGDSVGCVLPIGNYWCHCGMVTYIRRDRLGEKVCSMGKKTRTKIARMIGIEMGAIHAERDSVWEKSYEDTEKDWKEEAEHWKSLYNNLVGALNTINHAGAAV